MCSAMDESHVQLRSVPVATTPGGAVPLLGGIVEVCRHLSPHIGVWWLSPGESLGSHK